MRNAGEIAGRGRERAGCFEGEVGWGDRLGHRCVCCTCSLPPHHRTSPAVEPGSTDGSTRVEGCNRPRVFARGSAVVGRVKGEDEDEDEDEDEG